MAYAVDIINDSFKKTKELFFPIRFKYWVKMGFVNLFTGGNSGGLNDPRYSSNNKDFPSFANLRDALYQFNTKSLEFLSQYGLFIGIGAFFLYLIALFFSYISCVFTFMFIDGLVKKDIHIRKSFEQNNPLGLSLFFLRFIIGIVELVITFLIFSPLILAFFRNELSMFNFWLLIPMVLVWLLIVIVFGIFLFLVNSFVIPIMYFKKIPFIPAWKYFKKIAKKKFREIVIYWLFSMILVIGASILYLLLLLIALIPLILVLIVFVLIGVLTYFGISALGSELVALITVILYGILVILFLVFLITVLFVPIPAFFRIYSIEMLKKLESKT
ncbi:hypothetical protein JW930_07710 [Candidatus Woesearchaeota archaeon]|nr:hypothetical protein [Candidatus Woesearchaeota archaeon]